MRQLLLNDALDVLLDHRGKTPKKLGADFVTDGVPVASAILVADGRLDLASARRVQTEIWKRWMPVPTKAGDVLLTSEAPLGRVARVTTDEPLVLGQRLYGLRGKDGVLHNGYLYYALQTERVQADLLGRSTGTTVFGIRQSALRQVIIPAPEWEEQRAIAEVLGALDDKIAANARLVELADALAGALTRQSLSDEHVPLSDLADITMGSSPPGTSYNEVGRGYVFYQGVRDFGVRYPSNRVWTDAPVRTAEAGDTLVSVRAPVGRTNLASERICIGRGLGALRSTIGEPMTLFHLLRDDPTVWEPYEAEGTVFGSINRSQLETLPVRRVIEERRTSLEEDLTVLEHRVAAALGESSQLATTRDQLLPLLMSGKVLVKDAEKVVEGVV